MKYETLCRAALALPDTNQQPHHHLSSFRIHGRIFATVPPDQEYVHLFLEGQQRAAALAVHAEYAEPLLWGGKVVGVRIHFPSASAAAVKGLLKQAYEHQLNKLPARKRNID